jgi:glycosyltransferase involved in cell wall biosynthesis
MLRGGDVPGFEPKVLLLHRLLTPLRRTVYRASAAIAANSEGLRDLAVRADPGFPIRVIPNGVDSDFYRPSPLPKEAGAAFTFLFAGRFCDQKNIGRLLEAFAICRAKLPGARLTLVGEGSAARPLEALARDLDIGGALQWVAWSTKEDLLSRYRSSDCFVNPSKTEGMSNAVLEAMACGLPVLCGDCMGNREVVMNGENGFLFDPGDSGELARRMVALGKNRQWSLTLGAAGRRLCCERFSWARAADAVAAMLTGGAAGK